MDVFETVKEGKTDKKLIKTILEKDSLSYWDVKTLFQYVDIVLDKKEGAGLNYFSSVSTQVQEDVEWAIIKTKQIAETIIKLENSIEEQLNKSWEQIEGKFEEYYSKVSQLKKKAEEYKVLLPEVRVPYGWEDLLKLAEKLSYMPEEKQKAFLELVDRFKQIEQAK